jgi:hypothetical protein
MLSITIQPNRAPQLEYVAHCHYGRSYEGADDYA